MVLSQLYFQCSHLQSPEELHSLQEPHSNTTKYHCRILSRTIVVLLMQAILYVDIDIHASGSFQLTMCASHIPVFVNSYISNNNNILLINNVQTPSIIACHFCLSSNEPNYCHFPSPDIVCLHAFLSSGQSCQDSLFLGLFQVIFWHFLGEALSLENNQHANNSVLPFMQSNCHLFNRFTDVSRLTSPNSSPVKSLFSIKNPSLPVSKAQML